MPRQNEDTRAGVLRMAGTQSSDAQPAQTTSAQPMPMLSRKRTQEVSPDNQPGPRRHKKSRNQHATDERAEKDLHRDMEAIKNAWKESSAEGRDFLWSKRLQDESDIDDLEDINLPTGWTQDYEDALMKVWGDTAEKEAIDGIHGSQEGPISLWRMTTHLFRKTPFAVMDPLLGLCFDGDDAIRWSHGFCHALPAILAHPFWRQDVKAVSRTIQYAVVCRTDDRRKLPIHAWSDSCKIIRSVMRAASGGLTAHIHELHGKTREEAKKIKMRPSTESDFLYHLGELVKQKCAGEHDSVSDEHRYLVGIDDIHNILKALDTYKAGGWIPAYAPAKHYLRTYKEARGRVSVPHTGANNERLKELQTKAWLRYLRVSILNEVSYPNGPAHWTYGDRTFDCGTGPSLNRNGSPSPDNSEGKWSMEAIHGNSPSEATLHVGDEEMADLPPPGPDRPLWLTALRDPGPPLPLEAILPKRST